MGLSQALSTAMSGLRATQAAISLVGSNVANAETPGYVRKSVIQVAGMTGDYTFQWQYVVDAEDGEVSGRVVDLKGRARFGQAATAPAGGPDR